MDNRFNLITDFKVGQKFKVIESEVKKIFGRNHGIYYDIIEFIEVYSENRNTGHFKTFNNEIITLDATCVELINKNL